MIREIKWHNHKILGNLELNFTKPDGTPYNTIVLAGENGVGKTTILETLATFLNLETMETSVYKGYKRDKIEMRGDRAEMSDFPLYLNSVAGRSEERRVGKECRSRWSPYH